MVPERLIDLIDLIGPAATLKLVQAFGGERLYISSNPEAAGILADRVGAAAARTLGLRYPSTTIEVPAAHGYLARYYRNLGMNDGAIAVRLGITQAGVAELLR